MLQIDVNWLGERPLIRRPLGILRRVPTWAFRISHPRARNCSRRASWAPVKNRARGGDLNDRFCAPG